MTRVTILTTENLIEGTTGAIAMIITANIINYLFNPHLLVIGGVSFLIGWIARKIIINITNHWYYKLPNKDIVVDI